MFKSLSMEVLVKIHGVFERRMNFEDDNDDTPQDWIELLIILTPKLTDGLSDFEVNELRPIALGNVIQKWYLACVLDVSRQFRSAFKAK